MSDNGWRDSVRRSQAQAGIAEARRRLLIEWVRAEGVWRVDGKTFPTLLEAENYITRPEGEV